MKTTSVAALGEKGNLAGFSKLVSNLKMVMPAG